MPLPDDVARITLDDLHQLVADGEQEGVRLELKGDKPTKERLERGICAFANTSGGHFVIGVKGDEHTNQAIEVCGFAADRGLPEQLAQWLKEIRPRVNPAQSPLIDMGNGRVACVFYQPPSTLAPHMVSDWRYYMRAGATNTPMPEEMVSRYYLARQAGDRAALDLMESLQWGATPNDRTYLNMMVCPLRLDDDAVPITEILTRAMISYGDAIERRTNVLPGFTSAVANLRPSYHGLRGESATGGFLEIRRNGFVRAAEELRLRTSTGSTGVDIETLHAVISPLLAFVSFAIHHVQYHGYVMLVLTIARTSGTKLTTLNWSCGLDDNNGTTEESLTYRIEALADDLYDRRGELGETLVVRILQTYGLRVYEWKDADLKAKAAPFLEL